MVGDTLGEDDGWRDYGKNTLERKRHTKWLGKITSQPSPHPLWNGTREEPRHVRLCEQVLYICSIAAPGDRGIPHGPRLACRQPDVDACSRDSGEITRSQSRINGAVITRSGERLRQSLPLNLVIGSESFANEQMNGAQQLLGNVYGLIFVA